jgi:hypothetical protein
MSKVVRVGAFLAALAVSHAHAQGMSQVYRDGDGGYSVFNSDGSTSQAYRNGDGSYMVFNHGPNGENSTDDIEPSGNGYTVFHNGD